MAAQSTAYDYMNDSHQYYKCSLEGWCGSRRSVRLYFSKVVNGTPVSSPGIETKSIPTSTALNTLSKAKDLEIAICCGNHPVSICAVQDMLFAFVDRIPKDHRLRSLNVTITVTLPNDHNERSMVVSEDVWPAPDLGYEATIYENKPIQPGDLSRMHMVAFLADPLRKIRKLGGSGSAGHVRLQYPGRSGNVWKELKVEIKTLICGESEVKDYEVFRRYFEGIRHLIKSIQRAIKVTDRLKGNAMPGTLEPSSPKSLPPTPVGIRRQVFIDSTVESDGVDEVAAPTSEEPQVHVGLSDLQAITQALAEARIGGSFKDLREGHHCLLEMADNMLVAASRSPEDERLAGVLLRLQQNRDYAASIFPEEVDVSYYGYNESDAKLVEYRSGRQGYVARGAKKRT